VSFLSIYIQTSLSNLLVVDGDPKIFLISFLLVSLTTKSFCFSSKNGTPWCLSTFLNVQLVNKIVEINIKKNFNMSSDYIHIYNNLISLTRNKKLYVSLNRNDIFSDRLYFFLLHFAFFLKNFKSDENQKKLQEIYDFNFRQLELSIREIGYGDQSINKKMKDYINLFHGMLSDIHFWNNLNVTKKIDLLKKYLSDYDDLKIIVVYFDDFNENLSKKSLNLFLKSVIKP